MRATVFGARKKKKKKKEARWNCHGGVRGDRHPNPAVPERSAWLEAKESLYITLCIPIIYSIQLILCITPILARRSGLAQGSAREPTPGGGPSPWLWEGALTRMSLGVWGGNPRSEHTHSTPPRFKTLRSVLDADVPSVFGPSGSVPPLPPCAINFHHHRRP